MKLTKGTAHNNHFDKEIFTFTQLGEESNGEFMEMEITLESGGTAGIDALFHRHPKSAEIFTVTQGKIKVFKGTEAQEYSVGETVTVPPNTPHYFKNAADAVSKVNIRFEPALRYDQFFANFAAWRELNPEWFGEDGKMPLYLFAKLAAEYPDHMYMNHIPISLQKFVLAIIYRLGKLRHGTSYPLRYQ